MLTLLFIICFFAVFGKLLMFGIKAAWGISKFLLTIVLLPVKIMQGKAEREKENGRSERQAEAGSAGFIETASWYVPCLF